MQDMRHAEQHKEKYKGGKFSQQNQFLTLTWFNAVKLQQAKTHTERVIFHAS